MVASTLLSHLEVRGTLSQVAFCAMVAQVSLSLVCNAGCFFGERGTVLSVIQQVYLQTEAITSSSSFFVGCPIHLVVDVIEANSAAFLVSS